MNQLVSEVISKADIQQVQDTINYEQQKLRELVMKVNDGKLNNKEIVDAILDLDVAAGVNLLLSCDVK